MYQLFCNDDLIASAKYKQAIERHIVSVIDSYAEQGYTILNEDDNRVELINTNGDQINLTVGFVNDDSEIIDPEFNNNSTNHHVNNDSNNNDNDNNEQYIRKEITHMEQDKTTKINKQDEATTTNNEIVSVNNETIPTNNEVETAIKDSPNAESINVESIDAEPSQAEINNSTTAASNENIPQQNVDQSNINNDSVEPSQEESQNSNTKENINPAEEFDNRVATKIIEILSSQEYNYGNILSAFCANQISSMLVSNQLKPYFIQLNNAILNGKTSIMMEFAINGSSTIDIKYILAFCHMLMYLKYQLTFKSNSQVLIVQINW